MLQNREAELTILGMAMMDSKTAEKLCVLPPDTFTELDTRSLFLGIRRVIEKHGKPDLVTVKVACSELELDPGTSLLEASRLAITSANYDQYEAILMNLRKRRVLYAACAEVAAHVSDPGEDVNALTGKVLDTIRDSGEKPSSVSAKDTLISLTEHVERGDMDGVSTGVTGLDRLLGGLRPERFYVLGARPGVGKTALGLYIAENVALKGNPVLFASLEMSGEQVLTRIMARESGVDSEKIDNCKLSTEEWVEYSKAMPIVADLPMRFTETAKTPLLLRREAQAMIQNGGLKLIVVDYLQLMHADRNCKSRQEEMADVSRDLKMLTMDLKVPVLALTQFNRESEAKAGMKKRKPTMAEARESGAIEQDANVFMVLYPPEEPKQDSKWYGHWDLCRSLGHEWQLLCVDKNRHGRVGAVSLQFDKPHMDFTTIETMGEAE